MKKVIFFTENAWAFGSIHHSLSKLLYSHDILADVLDWSIPYTIEEMNQIAANYDYFVTVPMAVDALMSYGIPHAKMIVIAFGQWDILKANEKFGTDIYDKFHSYAVVSEGLKTSSRESGIARVPVVTPLGIIVDNFIRPVASHLETLGYASSISHENIDGIDIKRGHLVETIAKETNTTLRMNQKFNYLGMPSFYKSVDAVIMTSIEESVGLPMMEAAAAGRLTLGTPVGYYEKNAIPSGGILLPLDAQELTIKAIEQIELYKNNPAKFQKTCQKIQDYARAHYDWSHHINSWAKLLSN